MIFTAVLINKYIKLAYSHVGLIYSITRFHRILVILMRDMTLYNKKANDFSFALYRGEGSNLHKLSLLDPKSSASTNSATAA